MQRVCQADHWAAPGAKRPPKAASQRLERTFLREGPGRAHRIGAQGKTVLPSDAVPTGLTLSTASSHARATKH